MNTYSPYDWTSARPLRLLMPDGVVHEQSKHVNHATDNITTCGLFLVCYRTGVFGVYGPHRVGERPAEGSEDAIAVTCGEPVNCCICLAGED